jgi:hypothetical protein
MPPLRAKGGPVAAFRLSLYGAASNNDKLADYAEAQLCGGSSQNYPRR